MNEIKSHKLEESIEISADAKGTVLFTQKLTTDENTDSTAAATETRANEADTPIEHTVSYIMSGIKPPKNLAISSDIDMSLEWSEWLELYENYFIAAKIGKEEADVQTANFISTAGREVLKIINNLKLTDAEKKDLKTIKGKLTAHFVPSKNKTYERCTFHRLKQQENEPFEDYLQKLKTQVKQCAFPVADSDEFVMDQIVLGIHSDTTRQKLWVEDELTLEKAIKICRAAERAHKQIQELQSEATTSSGVNAIKQDSKTFDCNRCGYKHGPRACPAFGKNCGSCGRKNHFKAMCKKGKNSNDSSSDLKGNKTDKKTNRKTKKVHAIAMNNNEQESDTQSDSEEEYMISSLRIDRKEEKTVNVMKKDDQQKQMKVNSLKEEERWSAKMFVEKSILKVKLDTGAECNVLSMKEAKRFKSKTRNSPTKRLVVYNDEKIKVIGEVVLTCRNKKHAENIVFKVVNEDVQPILGRKMCEKMGFVKRTFEADIDTDVDSTVELMKNEDSHKQLKATKSGKQLNNSLKIHDIRVNKDSTKTIGCCKDFEYDIDFIDDPKFKIIPPRRVPHAIRNQVKKELEKMVQMNIIEPVSEPTPAVSPMHVVNKGKGKLRVCMDPTELNKNIKRRHYPLQTVEEITARVKGSKFFTKLDCEKGFWQIKVTERTSKFLAFATPWGRYKYLRLPFGISSAPEVFSEIMNKTLEGINNCEIAMDDIFLHAETEKELNKITKVVMKRIEKAGFTLNSAKCEFNQKRVKFLGHVFTEQGCEPDDEKIKAINQLKTPTNVKEVQRLLGMVNYVGKFIKNLSQLTEPLRKLLLKDTVWHWEAEQENAVNQIKKALTSLPVLGYYDVNAPVRLSVDASSKSMGCCLLQNNRPIAYGTRAFTTAQQNYPQIVKEAMAIRFGCTKFHEYVYGKELTIETDHKPLETIFKKSITDAPMRLQKILLDVIPYSPKVQYIKGTQIPIADTLSRDCNSEESETEETYHINSILAITDEAQQRFIKSTKNDLELQVLKEIIKKGWPENESELPEMVKKYANFKEELTYEGDLLFKGNRVIVPRSEIPKILNDLHKGHSGINSTLNRARQSTFWVGQAKDIKNQVETCAICQRTQRANTKEPALMKQVPDYPFQMVSSDVFKFGGEDYLLIADHYSGFFDFKKLHSATSTETIIHLREWFAVHGIPEIFESDGGTNYSSKKFSDFAREWKFEHRMSSPHYPRSNGFAERNVQTAKNLLKKCSMDGTDVQMALLMLRNTDRNEVLKSASRRLFSRYTRNTLPTDRKLLHPKVVSDVTEELTNLRKNQKKYFDKVSKPAESLEVGNKVRMKVGHRNWIGAQVVKETAYPRSVIVKTENGAEYRRNQNHLHKTKATIREPITEISIEGEISNTNDNTLNDALSTDQDPIETQRDSESTSNQSGQIVVSSNRIQSKTGRQMTTRSGRIVKPVERYGIEATK